MSTTDRVADALLWVLARRRPFTAQQLSRNLEVSKRTAHRYLLTFHAKDIVRQVHAPESGPDEWIWERAPWLMADADRS